MTRTTSIATMPRGWRIGRALMRPQRFTDLLALLGHTDALNRVLRKMVADGLAVKRNDGLYALTSDGAAWIECATPLLRWLDQHPRNRRCRRTIRSADDAMLFNMEI
jgi:DNA-binding HxlR family transcriptional regulator